MIESFKRPPGALRWPPRQRFSLSELGRTACEAHRALVDAGRAAVDGRDGLDRREREWAEPMGIEPRDGLYLSELLEGPKTAAQLAEALADCGATRPEAQAAV
ncbi:MAG: hypothetical protein ACYCWW_11535, partial [Deltaproteobacteria bacterium]